MAVVTRKGLTLTGGDVSSEGGGAILTGSALTLQDSIITGNHADGPGGGVFGSVRTRTITIERSKFDSNSTYGYYHDGGGAFVTLTNYSTLNVYDTVFTGSRAEGNEANGGNVFACAV